MTAGLRRFVVAIRPVRSRPIGDGAGLLFVQEEGIELTSGLCPWGSEIRQHSPLRVASGIKLCYDRPI